MSESRHELRDPDAVIAFRAAALADGWTIEPIYGPPGEPVESAWRLERDGYRLSGYTRTDTTKYPPRKNQPTGGYYCLSGWAADEIAIDPFPSEYPGFAGIVALSRHCPECGKDDVDTVRVGFANRACRECRPALAAKIEVGNWAE